MTVIRLEFIIILKIFVCLGEEKKPINRDSERY